MENKIHFVILEDNSYDSDLIRRELSRAKLNFTSVFVDSKQKFMDELQNNPPDIILSDFDMNGFDGVSAFHLAEKTTPGVPFIIISGHIGEEKSIELIKMGITDYVLKDKLFSLIPKIERALKDIAGKREKEKSDEQLSLQNKKLFEIAFLQSHEVRQPVANILGLIKLIKFDEPSAHMNLELIPMFKEVAEQLDNVMYRIMNKTDEIKALQ